jgi:1-acyl-sn-glycerol-3-phosphate acyltransferase
MLNTDLEDIIHKAEETKIILDFYFLLVVFIIIWLLLGRTSGALLAILIVFIAIYGTNEISGVQSISHLNSEYQGQEIVIENMSSSPFALSLRYKLALHLPIMFTGIVQTINRFRGDQKFMLTRQLACSLVMNSTNKVVYRTRMTQDPPSKIIFLCQHSSYLFDVFSFWAFIPKTHKLTAFNDVTRGLKPEIIGKIWYAFAENLYGVYPIDRADKENLKAQVSEFVDMITREDNRVFTIWPSGDVWDKTAPNGVKQFKLGAFFMSMFTGVPVCVIHGRMSSDEKKYIVEQSDIIYPPEVSNKESTYVKFYENESHRSTVDEYRLRVENIYREMDERIYNEFSEKQL